MKQPLLSICIPTYNRYLYLNTALKKIANQLINDELDKNVEIIISDNNSTDRTRIVINKYKDKYNFIKYFKNNKNIGINNNIIQVSSRAQGKYIWLLSDDDFILPGTLKLIINTIKKHEPIIIANNFMTCDEKQKKKNYKYLTSLKTKKDIYFDNDRDFFEYLSTESFFTIRSFYCASLSFYICNNLWFKKRINMLDHYYPEYKSSMYPQEWIFWWQFPTHKILVNSTPILNITEGNNSWANNFYQANIVVKKDHDPIMRFILKKYAKKMNLKLKIKLLASPVFTQIALTIGRATFIRRE